MRGRGGKGEGRASKLKEEEGLSLPGDTQGLQLCQRGQWERRGGGEREGREGGGESQQAEGGRGPVATWRHARATTLSARSVGGEG